MFFHFVKNILIIVFSFFIYCSSCINEKRKQHYNLVKYSTTLFFIHLKKIDKKRNCYTTLLSLILLGLECSTVLANPTIASVNYHEVQGRELITITSNSAIKVLRRFMLPNPPRLVIDIERVANVSVNLPSTNINSITKVIRFGHFNEASSRIVLELGDEDVGKIEYHVSDGLSSNTSSSNGHRLNIELKNKGARAVAIPMVSQPVAKAQTSFVPRPIAKPNIKPSIAHNNRLPTIIIDAGHGGKDPGALGSGKSYEKNITLRYALHLRDHLESTGRYNVVMTRSSDEFIFLHERVRIARMNGGVLFISVHADTAAEKSARGISVYTVSEQASDSEAEILAAQENASDAIGGIKFADDNPEVADILIDLASRDARIKATDFALMLVKNFQMKGLHLLKNPSRFAGFRVLKNPDIPSVLIEVGFLSNPTDEALLNTRAHMQQISSAILAAIQNYLQHHSGK